MGYRVVRKGFKSIRLKLHTFNLLNCAVKLIAPFQLGASSMTVQDKKTDLKFWDKAVRLYQSTEISLPIFCERNNLEQSEFIDLFSRSVIGWSMSNRLKSTLAEDALTMALFRRQFPKDVITHTDRGIQYCPESYQKLLKEHQLICSMSAKGCCYDNAAMESFFHTLKVELVHDENYKTRGEAKTSIVEYIECYYNRKRRHSTIGYVTPIEFEMTFGYAA